MVGSADPINGILEPDTIKTFVLLHETVGSMEPTNGFLDPVTAKTFVSLHETVGSVEPYQWDPRVSRSRVLGGTQLGHALYSGLPNACTPRKQGLEGLFVLGL